MDRIKLNNLAEELYFESSKVNCEKNVLIGLIRKLNIEINKND